MKGLLIANKDTDARERLAQRFSDGDVQVTGADSVANALEGIINKEIQVVVLDGHYDEQNVAKLIPLLKKCNRNLSIILVSDEMPMNLVRRIRQEGIFYHALRSEGEDNQEEIVEAVHYAFKKYAENTRTRRLAKGKEKAMLPIKSMLSTLAVTLLLVTPVWAADTSVTYNSGLLVLLFVGFCALLIVAQLVPAILVLLGMTKAVGEGMAEKKNQTAKAKN